MGTRRVEGTGRGRYARAACAIAAALALAEPAQAQEDPAPKPAKDAPAKDAKAAKDADAKAAKDADAKPAKDADAKPAKDARDPADAPAKDAPLVKTVVHPEQELRDDGKHGEYRFPLTLAAGVDAARLKIVAVRVSVGGRVDPGLLVAFNPRLEPTPGLGPELVLKVDFDVAAEPAAYEVDVVLASDAAKPVTQRLALKLTHPVATLKQPAPLVVTRAWPLSLNLGYPTEVTLQETSKRSRLSRIAVQQPEAPIHEDQAVGGRLTLTAPPAIDPGTSAALPLAIEGSFPVGTTRGKLEVRSAQLDQPLSIDYEMRVRVTSLAIPFLFLSGAFIAFLTRDLLKKREDALGLQLQAKELIKSLGDLAKRSAGDVRAALEQVVRSLQTLRGAELATAITEAGELLKKTIAERGTQQRELLAEAGRQVAILSQGWLLPPSLGTAAIRRGFDEAHQAAARDDVVAARVAMDGALDKARDLTRAGRAWAIEVEQELSVLAAARPPGGEGLIAALPDLKAGLGAIRAVKSEDGLEPLLRAVHAANEALLDHAWTVSRTLARLAEEGGAGAAGEALRKAAEMPPELATETDAKAALVRAARAAQSCEREVRALVDGMLPADEDRKQVAPMLDEHRFGDALVKARELAAARAKPRMLAGASGAAFFESGDDGTPEVAAAPVGSTPEPAAAPAGLAPRARRPAPRAEGNVIIMAAATPEQEIVEVGRALESTRFARNAIAAVIMAGLTWVLYEHDFFGNGRELLSIFALGFTTDLSSDAVFAALDKVKKT
jgi:hypothetical protein